MEESLPESAGMNVSRAAEDTLLIRLMGNWRIGRTIHSADDVQKRIAKDPSIKQIIFESKELTDWDSSILTFLSKIINASSEKGIRVVRDGMPLGYKN